MPYDFSQVMRSNPPAAAAKFGGFPKYNFVGGHNDGDNVPVEALIRSVSETLAREGSTLATYGLNSGPQSYRPLREGLAQMLERRAGMKTDADQILMVSGSLQALELINGLLLEPGDVVLVEEVCYGGALSRIKKAGASYVGVPVDGDGMRMDALGDTLDRLKAEGRRVKFIYTIPTVQNPSGSVMPIARRREMLELATRHDIPIVEDDCYCDLIFEGGRPSAIGALDDSGRVIYCGSFSKSIAPALRSGYVVADWAVISRLLPLKTDGGSGAIEQMMLSGFIEQFDDHMQRLAPVLKSKADALVDALEAEFGTDAEFTQPIGGIYLWITLPEAVDTSRLAVAAAAEGVAINAGAEWSADPEYGKRRLLICFANPTIETIQQGVVKLADVCHREFGIPQRGRNLERS